MGSTTAVDGVVDGGDRAGWEKESEGVTRVGMGSC
jgi:hypothetical protein